MNLPVTIQGAAGKLAAVIQKPDLPPQGQCPMVLLLHGFMSCKDDPIVRSVADALERRGIASLRFDFNGHGESGGDFQNMTVPNEIEDVQAVYSYARSLDYVSSLSLLGHSQGGVVASMAAGLLGAEKIRSLVLMAPASVLRDDAIRGNTMGARYNPLDPPEYIRLFNGLRLGRNYIRTAVSLPIFETAQKYTGSVCLIHGTGDRVVPYSCSEYYRGIYQKSELHLLQAADHGFSQDLQEAVGIAVSFLAGAGATDCTRHTGEHPQSGPGRDASSCVHSTRRRS